MSKPTAVLAADLHLRDTTPECRTDDFIAAMMGKLMFICNLALQHNVPLFVAGDFGEKSRWSHALEQFAISWFRLIKTIGIPGQHDLPNHSMGNLNKSAVGVLHEARAVQLVGINSQIVELGNLFIQGVPFGQKIKKINIPNEAYSVLLLHRLVTNSEIPDWPGQKATQAEKLLKHYNHDLILTGDNHKPFVEELDDKILVNPGAMTRHKADQVNHRPRVYLWYAKEYRVEPIYLPIEEGNAVITRRHIERKEERDERIAAYVQRLDDTFEVGTSFEENLQRFLGENKITASVQEKMRNTLESAQEELGKL